jgi:poly(A) polymerase
MRKLNFLLLIASTWYNIKKTSSIFVTHIQLIATEVVKKLVEKGFIAYFAGGFVRDLLIKIRSSDIDIATDALPEEIAAIFPHHILVGAEFGVCIVQHKGHQFEVATFRHDISYEDGRRPSQIRLKSSPEEDAKRRDFTINGMFFDPIDGKILDFVGGQEDIEKGIIRTIGDPYERFSEDRLRMIRAVRFAMRFNFSIENATKKAITKLANSILPAVSMERIWQEFCKIRSAERFSEALLLMAELGLLETIFPPLQKTPKELFEKRLEGVTTVSSKVPTILILCQLFDAKDIPFILTLSLHLKASKAETKWIETFLETKALWQQDPLLTMRYEWTYLLADHRARPCFELLFCKFSEHKQQEFWQRLDHFTEQFASHIDRIHKRKPLCQAKDLEAFGIRPGKKMGELLRLAEKIAIGANISQKEEVIAKLTQDPVWFQIVEDVRS